MKKLWIFSAALGLLTSGALAGQEATSAVVEPQPGPFDRGTWEVELGSGYFQSYYTNAKRPTVNDQIDTLRLGWMYDNPRHDNWLGGLLRGNSELMMAIYGAAVTEGAGTYFAGGALLWTYNFLQPDSRWAPYFQLGAGALGNDIYHEHPQREIGENFEFLLQGDAGLKYLINDQWSIGAEGGYQHISNADLASRNEGLNSLGGMLVVSYRFH
jgi:opacity protein-like surface antigen